MQAWGRRFNAHRALRAEPQPALDAIARWCQRPPRREEGTPRTCTWHAFTTNTDGVSKDALDMSVWECHGSTELWRCAGGCSGVWRAPDGFRFRLAPAGEGQAWLAPAGEPQSRPAYHKVEMSSEEAMDCTYKPPRPAKHLVARTDG